jgi:hypothetical protein
MLLNPEGGAPAGRSRVDQNGQLSHRRRLCGGAGSAKTFKTNYSRFRFERSDGSWRITGNRGPRAAVPEDIAVVGFDDIALAKYTEPPLTTVVQLIREIGKLATELVMARVNGERTEPQRHRLTTSLVVRGSCGIRPSISGKS